VAEPDEPFYLHAVADPGKGGVILKLLLYLRDRALVLDAFFHQKQNQACF
jgi:hypothetical protein